MREGAVLGPGCIIGKGAYIDADVQLGANCKVQNYSCVYYGATLEDGVFVGPEVVFTNDRYPGAINPDGSLKSEAIGKSADAREVRCRDRLAFRDRDGRDDRALGAGGGRLGRDEGRARPRAGRRQPGAADGLGLRLRPAAP